MACVKLMSIENESMQINQSPKYVMTLFSLGIWLYVRHSDANHNAHVVHSTGHRSNARGLPELVCWLRDSTRYFEHGRARSSLEADFGRRGYRRLDLPVGRSGHTFPGARRQGGAIPATYEHCSARPMGGLTWLKSSSPVRPLLDSART